MADATGWLPIETAPKDAEILATRPGWYGASLLRWKFNDRIKKWYFGNPVEDDDYDLAEPEYAVTLWHPIPPIPEE